MEFDETPRFWYPRVARVAWIDFSSQTIELRQSKCRENLPFSFLPFSSSLSRFSFSPPRILIHRFFFSLVCSYPPFILFIFIFLFLFFFIFILSFLLISFSLFLLFGFSFFLFLYPLNSPSGEASSPPLYSHPHMPHVLSIIFLDFLDFLSFPFISFF